MYELALCITLLITPQQPVKKNIPAEHKQNQPSGQASGKTLPASPIDAPREQTTPTPNPQQQQSNTSSRTERIEIVPQPPDWWFKGYVILTGVIAFLNLGMLIAIFHQRNAMREQLKLMEDESKQQQKITMLEYRAWMKFKKVDFIIAPNNAWMYLECLPRDGKPTLSYGSEKNVPASPVVPPYAPLTFPIELGVITDRDYATIVAGKMLVFFHGKITYKDIFGSPHWMTFCQRFDPDDGKFMIHQEHNETDE
jgi:hypothetical protein